MALIGLIHSTRLVIEPVHKVVSTGCQNVEVIHVLDEGLLRALHRSGWTTEQIMHWLGGMVKSAAEEEANLAVVTCSSLSPCVNTIREMVNIPVLKIDEPMVEYAVSSAEKIGVVMTNPSTVKPSTLLIEEVSQRLGKKVDVTTRICKDAFLKLNAGDIQGHDNEVIKNVHELLNEVELVMLAQISIARVLEKLDEVTAKKVLSSLDFIAPKINETLAKFTYSGCREDSV